MTVTGTITVNVKTKPAKATLAEATVAHSLRYKATVKRSKAEDAEYKLRNVEHDVLRRLGRDDLREHAKAVGITGMGKATKADLLVALGVPDLPNPEAIAS